MDELCTFCSLLGGWSEGPILCRNCSRAYEAGLKRPLAEVAQSMIWRIKCGEDLLNPLGSELVAVLTNPHEHRVKP